MKKIIFATVFMFLLTGVCVAGTHLPSGQIDKQNAVYGKDGDYYEALAAPAEDISITRVTIPSQGQQRTQKLLKGTKRFKLQPQNSSEGRFSFVSGSLSDSGAYYTIKSGGNYDVDGIDLLADTTVYITITPSGEMEIIQWK